MHFKDDPISDMHAKNYLIILCLKHFPGRTKFGPVFWSRLFRRGPVKYNYPNRPGQSDYPRTPQDTPGHPRTLQDSIICMFNILYEPVDDGLVLVCWCINQIILTDQFGWMDGWKTDVHDQA